jgi:TRPM family ion channel
MTSNRFPISFADGSVALAVRAGPGVDLAAALRGMGLTTGVATVVVVGAGSRPSQLSRLGPLLEKVVVRVADALRASVVDEGTAGGLPALLGAVRERKKADFPLVGVAPYPGDGLDPGHTHFVLAPPGDGVGDGIARWVTTVADALAGGNRSVALLVAGGEPAWAAVRAQLAAGRTVLVVSRTGGVADHLTAALAGRPADERAGLLARSGRVHAVDPGRGATHVAEVLRDTLVRGEGDGAVVVG